MMFIKYLSEGNSVGLEFDIESYWEINELGYVTRCVEVINDGDLLKYSEEHLADSYGQLPEGKITGDNLNDKSFGNCIQITDNEFESIWLKKSINLDSKYNKNN